MTVQPPDRFVDRHNGPREAEVAQMLAELGLDSLGGLIRAAVPANILTEHVYDLPAARTEREVLADLAELADQNRTFRSYLGLGYHGCVTPPVILRNVLENPAWYTQYTPYQAEISQGRLEALLNFQTLVADLTGMEVANSSMLDEATSAAEVMTLFRRVLGRKAPSDTFLVDPSCHPQTVEVIRTRAAPLGIDVVVAEAATYDFSTPVFGVLLQVPSTDGAIRSPAAIIEAAHAAGALVVVASDLLALTRMRSPGSWGADAVVGNSQRLGVPMGFGGPHAAFLATRAAYKRQVPGRIVGVSKDSAGRTALRLALQTREQHIRRDRATSNICTAQVLLAVIASMYVVYHGPEGLQRIADGVVRRTRALGEALAALGYSLGEDPTFDTLHVSGGPRSGEQIHAAAVASGINLRAFDDGSVGVSLDETTRDEDVLDVLAAFGGQEIDWDVEFSLPEELRRDDPILTHPVFSTHRSETDLLRYIHKLSSRDLSLTTSMIPLGSCTMKLNATAQMVPVTWAGFGQLHPFAPADQTTGYRTLFLAWRRGLRRSPVFPASACSPMRVPRGSTQACW
jgi:glycine dehydrogenase